jgi:hypothetical protein
MVEEQSAEEDVRRASRSLRDVINEDFLAIQFQMLELIVPNLEKEEMRGIPKALTWLKVSGNLERFNKMGTDKSKDYGIPDEVRSFGRTLKLILDLGVEVEKGSSSRLADLYNVNVGFRLCSGELRSALTAISFRVCDRLKEDSGKTGSVISEFYDGGGVEKRSEAIDILCCETFGEYWDLLKKRAIVELKKGNSRAINGN